MLKMYKSLWRFVAKILPNSMTIKCLCNTFRRCVNRVEIVRMPRFGVLHRAVLHVLCNVPHRLKYLIVRLLNDIYIVADVMKYGYLCIAKVPYYGRSTYRHRAHDYASPLCDAAGSRGIVSKGQ